MHAGPPIAPPPPWSLADASLHGIGSIEAPLAPATIQLECAGFIGRNQDTIDTFGFEELDAEMRAAAGKDAASSIIVEKNDSLFNATMVGKWLSDIQPCTVKHRGLCADRDELHYRWVIWAASLVSGFLLTSPEDDVGKVWACWAQEVVGACGSDGPVVKCSLLGRNVKSPRWSAFLPWHMVDGGLVVKRPVCSRTVWSMLLEARTAIPDSDISSSLVDEKCVYMRSVKLPNDSVYWATTKQTVVELPAPDSDDDILTSFKSMCETTRKAKKNFGPAALGFDLGVYSLGPVDVDSQSDSESASDASSDKGGKFGSGKAADDGTDELRRYLKTADMIIKPRPKVGAGVVTATLNTCLGSD